MTQTASVAVRVRITPEHRRAYLETLAATGSHPNACQAVGVARRTMAAHIAAHADFADEVEDARQQFAASLLAEAKRRAVDGLTGELVLYEGEPVRDPETGELLRKPRRYSDRLLLALIEKMGPDEFRAPERVVHEHTHSGIVTHTIAPEVLAAMNPAARIEARRVVLLSEMRDKPDAEKQAAVLALAQDASRDGVDLDVFEMARTLRIGKLAAVDAEYEEIDPDYDLKALEELF